MADDARLRDAELTGNGASGRVVVPLADLARGVVAQTDPGQLDLLPLQISAWEAGKDRGRRRGWLAGTVEFGVDPIVTSQIILPVLVNALSQVLGTAAIARLKRRKRCDAHALQVTLDAGQLDQFLSECVADAIRQGLPKSKATVLGDAIYGVLCRRLTDPGQQP
jgi:hypothetical protein